MLATLKTTWMSSLTHTSEDHSSLLFDSLYDAIEECRSTPHEESEVVLSYYLQLLDVAVVFKNGRFIPDQRKLYMVYYRFFE